MRNAQFQNFALTPELAWTSVDIAHYEANFVLEIIDTADTQPWKLG